MDRDGTANSKDAQSLGQGSESPSSTASGTRDVGSDPSYESTITEIWKSLLGLPEVSIDDNFFEVGGTSLLATILLTRVNKTLGRELPIATVFEHATVRSLANLLRGD